MTFKSFVITLVIILTFSNSLGKKPKSKHLSNYTRPSSKYDNPNFIRDRYRDEIWKPIMNASWVNRFTKPFHPAWMDYCDPYHCNDYHKRACGLNRKTMRFKWFQSRCHVILNNLCANYRGALRYDVVASENCYKYVMFLRTPCPEFCPDNMEPVCGISSIDNHLTLFLNKCTMDRVNCREGILEEYEEVNMEICNNVIYIE